MKQHLVNLAGALALGTAVLPAHAGPDSQTIDHIRRVHQAAADEKQGNDSKPAEPERVSSFAACPPQRPVLLMDRGPRPKGTPAQNKALSEAYEEQIKACNIAVK